MFEKPKYITPDGFKRTRKNPTSCTKRSATQPPTRGALKKTSLTSTQLFGRTNKPISKKAAQIIALAIKDLLKN